MCHITHKLIDIGPSLPPTRSCCVLAAEGYGVPVPEAREGGIEGGWGMFVRAVMREVNVLVAGLRTTDLSYLVRARVMRVGAELPCTSNSSVRST